MYKRTSHDGSAHPSELAINIQGPPNAIQTERSTSMKALETLAGAVIAVVFRTHPGRGIARLPSARWASISAIKPCKEYA